jgi:hypothetical protein
MIEFGLQESSAHQGHKQPLGPNEQGAAHQALQRAEENVEHRERSDFHFVGN